MQDLGLVRICSYSNFAVTIYDDIESDQYSYDCRRRRWREVEDDKFVVDLCDVEDGERS